MLVEFAPQLLLAAASLLELFGTAMLHGRPKTAKWNFPVRAIEIASLWLVLWWGGWLEGLL
jgi:hypothetical protein